MLRGRGKPRGDHLKVQHVVVVQGLDGVGHAVDGTENMVSVRTYAPAQLHSIIFMDNAGVACFFLQGAVHIPFPVVLEPYAFLINDCEVPNLDVSQILPNQIPFGNVVPGIDVPGFTDHDPAFGQEGNLDVQIFDALLVGGGKGDGEREQGKKKAEFQVRAHGRCHFYKDSDLLNVNKDLLLFLYYE